MRRLLVPGFLMVATLAHAETADEAVARGQALARDGKHVAAIAAFRAAESSQPRAIHDCLIGLAYLRTGALTESDIAFADCHRRDREGLPAWVAKEEASLSQQLAASDYGTVALKASPAIETITISGVLEGLPFAPRAQVRLRAGTFQVTGQGDNGRTVTREVTLAARGKAEVTLELPDDGATTPPPVGDTGSTDARPDERPRHDTDIERRPSRAPIVLTAAGGAVLVTGAVMHLLWVKPTRERADDATELDIYNRELDKFHTARAFTVASYAVGGAALIVGLLWWQRSPSAPRVSGYVGGDGGGFAIEWQH